MSTHLESKDLINTQQMEVAVNGPDGATHLVLCTGIANLSACSTEIFTFYVGPKLSRPQFVGVIASGALSTIQAHKKNSRVENSNMELGATLISIDATYDESSNQVKVSADVVSSLTTIELVVCWLNNARNSLPGLAEHGSVDHLPKMGDEPCEVASQRNFS